MLRSLIGSTTLAISSLCFANQTLDNYFSQFPIYLSGHASVFTTNYQNTYTDLSDVISQNISELSQQQGYSEGLALGFTHVFQSHYFYGAEISANFDSHKAIYQSGSASAAFSDTSHIENHFDLTFVPGINLSESVAAYLKLGVSYAYLKNTLTSPAGYTPVIVTTENNRHITGFASAIGLRKSLSQHAAIFLESDFHDYGTVNFPNFQNFTASYSHAAHVYSFETGLGLSYQF